MIYQVNNDVMLGVPKLEFFNKNPKDKYYEFMFNEFIPQIAERVSIFDGWLEERGLPTDFSVLENVGVVDSFFDEHFEWIKYEQDESFNSHPAIAQHDIFKVTIKHSMLTPEWESLYLDFMFKVGDSYIRTHEGFEWGVKTPQVSRVRAERGLLILINSSENVFVEIASVFYKKRLAELRSDTFVSFSKAVDLLEGLELCKLSPKYKR